MPRRYATSAPPRSKPSHRSRPHQHHSNEQPEVREKECGFDWTPGIILALVGTLTWLNHDFDKTRRRTIEGHKQEARKGSAADGSDDDDESDDSVTRSSGKRRPRRGRGRDRERERSKARSVEHDDGGVDEKYYEYGPKRGGSTGR
ncbi:hypothetical protein AK830_g2973 [Neonectria ditissima]|uniref:Uncharacterized protein n=1 Tax=Neonectria ditissima TaxID=78410 RepID=A0A0N8H854_9HYPO|nr:hypothetical protein AK830_g2973 [Neonectria ditissima]